MRDAGIVPQKELHLNIKTKGDAKGIAYQHEYIIFYAKNRDALTSTNEIKRPKKNAAKILDMTEKYFSKISNNYTLEMANKDFGIWINAQSELSGGEKAYNKMDDKGDVYRAVSMARFKSLEKISVIGNFFNRFCVACACCLPTALSGISACPMLQPSVFQSVSPCRIK